MGISLTIPFSTMTVPEDRTQGNKMQNYSYGQRDGGEGPVYRVRLQMRVFNIHGACAMDKALCYLFSTILRGAVQPLK